MVAGMAVNAKHVRRMTPAALIASAALVLAGCSSGGAAPAHHGSSVSSAMSSARSSSAMHHDMSGSAVPAGMTKAKHPKFAPGSTVVLTADHMEGMQGAKATVVGAYATTAYAVTYTPTTGGDPVVDHKWVVQEEIQGAGDKPFPKGAEVTLLADHMKGMKGAHATIDSSTRQTVYVVDYTANGMTMKNHKWVVEDEMRAP